MRPSSSGYVFLAAGLLRIQQARSAKRDITAILDTAIITLGFAAASWVFFMAPLLHDPEASLLERLTVLGYPVADVLVLAVTARFVLAARRPTPVFVWLAGTVVVMLAADTVYSILNLLDLYDTGHPIDLLILAYNLGLGSSSAPPRGPRPDPCARLPIHPARLASPGGAGGRISHPRHRLARPGAPWRLAGRSGHRRSPE